MNYQALLLDLDGVLRHWPHSSPATDNAFKIPAAELAAVRFAPPLLNQAITGKITDEAWRDLTLAELGQKFPQADLGAIRESWHSRSSRIDSEVLALVQVLSRKLKVTLITNATSRLNFDLEQVGLSCGIFHAIVNSSEVGAAKPDRRIFDVALQRSGVTATQALFVDDSERNVDAANSFGIRSHLYTGYNQLQTFLRECAV